MTQPSLFDALPAAVPDPGGWSPLTIEGRAYRWRYLPEQRDPDLPPENLHPASGHWMPTQGTFELQYLNDGREWCAVRYVHRRDHAWGLVRTLPGMPGEGS